MSNDELPPEDRFPRDPDPASGQDQPPRPAVGDDMAPAPVYGGPPPVPLSPPRPGWLRRLLGKR